MKDVICTRTGESIALVQQIAASGEGEVWQSDRPGTLAKLYTHPTPDRIRKLEVMVAYPPRDPNQQLDHISYAWPQSLLMDRQGQRLGFLMPKVDSSVELIDVYNPRRRQKVIPAFNWMYLHTTALNIASLIWAIHEAGYVVGDIKPQNILVTNQALPSIIDTDSFQVIHPQTGKVFHCPVGSDGFTPVELLGQDLATVKQTEIHDRFRLGVIIYLMLFGDHPFKGKWVGSGDSPEPNELIRQGFWPFGKHSLIKPGPLTAPLTTVHPLVQEGFVRCFSDGHTDPTQRPSAQEWFRILTEAIAHLKPCRANPRHYYSDTTGRARGVRALKTLTSKNPCYWCERKQQLGIDIFDVKRGDRPKPRPATLPQPPAEPTVVSTVNAKLRQFTPATISPQALKTLITTVPLQVGQRIGQDVRSRLTSIRSIRIDPQSPWLKLGGVVGVFMVVVGLLLTQSSAGMTPDEVGMTMVGTAACSMLFLVGFLWLKFLDQQKL